MLGTPCRSCQGITATFHSQLLPIEILFWCSVLQLHFPTCTIKSSRTLMWTGKTYAGRRLRKGSNTSCFGRDREEVAKGTVARKNLRRSLRMLLSTWHLDPSTKDFRATRNARGNAAFYITQVWATSSSYCRLTHASTTWRCYYTRIWSWKDIPVWFVDSYQRRWWRIQTSQQINYRSLQPRPHPAAVHKPGTWIIRR